MTPEPRFSTPPPEIRAICRTALGEEVIASSAELMRFSSSDDDEGWIPLHSAGVYFDVHAGWLTQRLDRYHRELERFAQISLSDRRRVGRRLRKRTARLIDHMSELARLSYVLHAFNEEIAATYASWASYLPVAAATRIRQITAVEDRDAFDAGVRYGELRQAIDDIREFFLNADEWTPEDVPDVEDVLAVGMGQPPQAEFRGFYDVQRAYLLPGVEKFGMAFRQLSLLGDIYVPDEFVDTYLGLACRVATNQFPLLTHWSAFITGELIAQGAATDHDAAGRALSDFNVQQAGRINSAGETYEELIERVRRDYLTYDLPDAYRTVAEGVLRPYWSLLLALHEVAAGRSAAFRMYATLGELVDASGQLDPELLALLELGVNRELRNYEAHEDVVRSATGVFAVVDAAGDLQPLDMEALFEQVLMLRAILDGIDIAANVAFIPLVALSQPFPVTYTQTEATVRLMCRMSAARLTDGSVADATVNEGQLLITFEGPPTRVQLELLAAALWRRVDPAIRAIRVEDPNGGHMLSAERPDE